MGVNVGMKFIGAKIAVCLMAFSSAELAAQENASNPLAAVDGIDARFQYFDLSGPDLYDLWADGSWMISPKMKLKYELHYQQTDVSGSTERDWESLHLKPIFFPENWKGKIGEWKYKVAIGGEAIIDFGMPRAPRPPG